MNDVYSWLEKPLELVKNWDLVPQVSMTKSELLNTMTRLILIITIVLFLIGMSGWWLFLILSLVFIFIIWYTTIRETETKNMRIEWYRVPKQEKRHSRRKSASLYEDYELIPR